jgi:type VII secretion protein EccE
VIASETVAVAVFAVLRVTGVELLPAVAAAVAVGVVGAALAIRAPSDISVYGRLARRVAYLRRSGRTPEDPPIPFDLPQPDGTSIGVRWSDDRLISVVRIARPVAPTALLPSNSIVSPSGLSLGVIARALAQFDIELESIDVVAHGWRTRAAAHLSGPYASLTASLPTVPQQDVWVVLRLNPLLCPDAIAARGGGPTGVLRTAITATRRVANLLAHQGYRTTILSAAGISAMDSQLVDHSNVDDASEAWDSVVDRSYSTTSYALTRTIDADLSTAIWTTPSLSTTCSIRLTSTRGGYELTSVVRYASVGDLELRAPEALRRLDGRQRAALDRTLATGRHEIPGLPRDVLSLDALDQIRVVDGGHGQLFGANPSGQAVAVPLFGSDVRRVDLYGSAFLAQQIVVRAIAVGARVVIRTDRPDAWATLVQNVNDPRSLFMYASPIEQRTVYANYSLCILDAREATEDPTIGTQLRIHRTAANPEPLDETSDVALYQDVRDQQRVFVVTRSDTCVATLVALPSESTLIDGSRVPRRQQPEPVTAGAAPQRSGPPPGPPGGGPGGPQEPPSPRRPRDHTPQNGVGVPPATPGPPPIPPRGRIDPGPVEPGRWSASEPPATDPFSPRRSRHSLDEEQ